ncbi:hypothetical protein GCM10010222_60360 [Streptomyces tanashiensis]|nr:hypothetical protein GCM10010222_60360 [Streptomyces tanashiensis]
MPRGGSRAIGYSEADAARALGQSPDPGQMTDPRAQTRILPPPAAGTPIRHPRGSHEKRQSPVVVTFCRHHENHAEPKSHPKGGFTAPRIATRRQRPDGAVPDPAAFAAVRTAPATAPATLSLKTDGMM